MSTVAREKAGFYLDYHAPTGKWWLYVPAGTDPADGAPLTWARPATPHELKLWELGKIDQLAALLAAQGVPVQASAPRPRRSLMRRLFGKLLGRR